MDKACGKLFRLVLRTLAFQGRTLIYRCRRSHSLRYVLRNKATGQVYLVILFTLYLKEDVNEDGSIKPHALEAAKKASGHVAHDGAKDSDEEFDEEKAIQEARRKLSGAGADDGIETSADDVD